MRGMRAQPSRRLSLASQQKKIMNQEAFFHNEMLEAHSPLKAHSNANLDSFMKHQIILYQTQ
jgi:hypothetical protein